MSNLYRLFCLENLTMSCQTSTGCSVLKTWPWAVKPLQAVLSWKPDHEMSNLYRLFCLENPTMRCQTSTGCSVLKTRPWDVKPLQAVLHWQHTITVVSEHRMMTSHQSPVLKTHPDYDQWTQNDDVALLQAVLYRKHTMIMISDHRMMTSHHGPVLKTHPDYDQWTQNDDITPWSCPRKTPWSRSAYTRKDWMVWLIQ